MTNLLSPNGAAAIARLTAVLLSILVLSSRATEEAVDINSGSVELPQPKKGAVEQIPCPVGRCARSSSSRHTSVYKDGGSAQAYKPDAPFKSVVCDAEVAKERRYRVASWPLRRSNYKSAAPLVEFRGRIWTCSGDENKQEEECVASPLSDGASAETTVEVWQARPDGSYSSLAPGYDEGECRSTLSLDPSSSAEFRFHTVAPGSSGSLGGLGPSGYDFPPYAPPAIHLLIRTPGYDAMLIDVMFMPEGRTFRGGDWRGHGWVGSGASSDMRYEVSTMDGNDGSMAVEAEFFLTTRLFAEDGENEDTRSIDEELCQSRLYGFRPKSFFTEPIAVCAPSLMDYFDL